MLCCSSIGRARERERRSDKEKKRERRSDKEKKRERRRERERGGGEKFF